MKNGSKKIKDNRIWNILAVLFLIIWHGTIGTTIILLPFIVFAVRIVFKAFDDSRQSKSDDFTNL